MKSKHPFILMAALLMAACTNAVPSEPAGARIGALDNAAWDAAQWISAADAPVATGRNVQRAADGASWFVATLKNDKEVVTARWMTTGLGVYQLI